MKSPAFQFYPDAWLASQRVTLLTLEEEGAYVRLLGFCWLHGSIPSCPDQCAHLIGKGCSTTVAGTVLKMFIPSVESGRMIHDRLELEREKQAIWRSKSAEGGRKSAISRAKTSSNGGSTTVKGARLKGGLTFPSPSPSPSPSPISGTDLQSPSPKFVQPEIETMKLQGQKIGLPDPESEACFHYYEANGWKVGRHSMKNWQSAMQNWKRNYDQRRTQTYKGNNNGSHRPLTGAEQRRVGIPETPGLGAAEIIRLREQRKLSSAKDGMAAPPVQAELGSTGSAGNG